MTQSINQQSNYQKFTPIVNKLIDNNPLYRENLNRQEMIENITRNFDPVAVPDVNSISKDIIKNPIHLILPIFFHLRHQIFAKLPLRSRWIKLKLH